MDANFGVPDAPSGGGGGGGAARQNDLEREIESIAQETNALRLEAQVLAEVAGQRIKQGDALEYARTKAELLAAAQRSGVQITPQITAQIDALAREYTEAGTAAELPTASTGCPSASEACTQRPPREQPSHHTGTTHRPIGTYEESTIAGLVVKAQAMQAWASVEPFYRALQLDAELSPTSLSVCGIPPELRQIHFYGTLFMVHFIVFGTGAGTDSKGYY